MSRSLKLQSSSPIGRGGEPIDRDELTGTLTRRHLLEALQAVLAPEGRPPSPCVLLLIGINDLSITNEMFGFDVGDELIAAVSRVLEAELDDGDVLGRYSSNKFGAILHVGDAGGMRAAADRLLRAVRDTRLETSVCRLAATVSIGGINLPEQAANADEAVSRALRALSRARQKPGGGFSPHEARYRHNDARHRNIRVARDVVSALEAGRMRLALQPIISTATWQPSLYECLLRMELSDGRTISAGDFIGIAEQLGLARLIDQRVLELAVAILHEQPDLHLAINVSGLTCSDRDWLDALRRLARTAGLAERLTVEITETAAIHDLDHSAAFVDALKELGCRVAIDDFGAGYTSFRTLKHLAIDMVKIDGAFVRNLPSDNADQAFVRAMVELAGGLKLETVAECVADEQTARLLADAGVSYLQGFHFGEPVMAGSVGGRRIATSK